MESKIFFKNSKGLNLSGILNIPDSEKKVPLVVICHGLNSSKEGSTYRQLSEILYKNGIASLRFDFVSHGDSEGDPNDFGFSESVEDLKEAIKAISDNNKIDFDRIGLFGRSFGGGVSLKYASQFDNLKLLCLNAPAIDWKEIFKNMYSKSQLREWKMKGYVHQTLRDKTHKIDYSFYTDSVNADIYKNCSKIKVKTFIVHGDADDTVPYLQSIKLKDKTGDNVNIEIIKGADHDFAPGKQEKSVQLCADFIIENI